jgi:ribonuclease VapC
MIFLETSAIVAVFLKQPDMLRVLNTLEKDPYIVTGAHVRLEACMVLSSRLAISATEANVRLQRFLDELKIAIEPLTDEIAIEAVLAFDKYGKGRNSTSQIA